MMYGDWSWWWMLPMTVFTFLVVAAVLWIVVTAIRTGAQTVSATPPEDVLSERFARGEIDIAEYTERANALRKVGGRSPAFGSGNRTGGDEA